MDSVVDGVDIILRSTAGLLQRLPLYYPSVQTWVEDGLVITVAGHSAAPYNGVLVLDEQAVTSQALDEIQSLYREANLHFGIEVGSYVKTPACDTVLRQHGYVQTVIDSIMSLQGTIHVPVLNERVKVYPVTTHDTREQYKHVLMTTFGMPLGVASDFFDTMLNIVESRQMIAFLDGNPVGSGMLLCIDDTATIYNVATLPTVQRQGVGTAMMLALHERALYEGFSGSALSVQSSEGFSLYQHLGYKQDGYRSTYELID